MASSKSFAVFDGDSHVVEPREVWEKYLEPEYRVPGKLALWREEGKLGSYLKINGEMFRDTDNMNIPSHGVWRPGMTWESVGELDPNIRHPVNEGAWDPQARLRDMDAIGVDQAFLYPTWFAEGFPLVKDPDVAYALARAYNNWIADFCKAAPDRLFAAAIVPLQNMDFALEELRRVAKIPCFRGVFVRPAFIEDRYLNHPYYEPLWAELESLGRWRPRSIRRRVCGTPNGPRTDRLLRRSRPGLRKAAASSEPAEGRLQAAAVRCSRSMGYRWATRCRRFCRIGWTTTCSSARRCWAFP